MWAQQQPATDTVPFTNTITHLINKMVSDGYTDSFKVTTRGLYSCAKSRYYRAEQVRLISSYLFENTCDAGAHSTMYVIETSDGVRGTLVECSDDYSDGLVNSFMAEVGKISMQMARHAC